MIREHENHSTCHISTSQQRNADAVDDVNPEPQKTNRQRRADGIKLPAYTAAVECALYVLQSLNRRPGVSKIINMIVKGK